MNFRDKINDTLHDFIIEHDFKQLIFIIEFLIKIEKKHDKREEIKKRRTIKISAAENSINNTSSSKQFITSHTSQFIEPFICYACKKPGYYAANCPNKNKN